MDILPLKHLLLLVIFVRAQKDRILKYVVQSLDVGTIILK